MQLDQRDHVVIVTSERPLPPLYGNNRKIHDVMLALQDSFHLHVIAYAPDKNEFHRQLVSYWAKDKIDWHLLEPNQVAPTVRALATGRLRFSALRRFDLEKQIIERIRESHPGTRLIIDDVVGAELLKSYRSGTVISCNDCSSALAYHEMRLARSLHVKARGYLRYQTIDRIERQYLQLAEIVHVVKQEDGDCIRDRNPKVNIAVISLASPGVVPHLAPNRPLTHGPLKLLIWADLSRSSILSGYTALVPQIERVRLWEKMSISVLGRVPKTEFLSVSGKIGANLDYATYVDDLNSFVQQFDIVLLPDIAGSGQKFRLVDGLRLGKCLVGFEHPFEGLPTHAAPYFIKRTTPEDVVAALESLNASGAWYGIGLEAQQVFKDYFGFDHFRASWVSLVQRLSLLGVS